MCVKGQNIGSQIILQRFMRKVAKPITLAFDEYGVWDETVGKLTLRSGLGV